MAYDSNLERTIDIARESFFARDNPDSKGYGFQGEQTFREYYGMIPGRVFINAYAVTQGYGGPEEGGWWYEIREPVASMPVHDPTNIETVAKLLDAYLESEYGDRREYYSAAGGEDGSLVCEDHPAKAEPETRPHYE